MKTTTLGKCRLIDILRFSETLRYFSSSCLVDPPWNLQLAQYSIVMTIDPSSILSRHYSGKTLKPAASNFSIDSFVLVILTVILSFKMGANPESSYFISHLESYSFPLEIQGRR